MTTVCFKVKICGVNSEYEREKRCLYGSIELVLRIFNRML